MYAANKSLNIPLTKELYEVKIRYRSNPIKARVSVDNGIITAQLQESAYGVAKGQALVVYDGDVVLGGGVIV